MCDGVKSARATWQGWIDLPSPRAQQPTGEWVDLSHIVTEDLSRSAAFPRPEFRKLLKMPEGNANITEIHMVAHHGTHVDAPSHFMEHGPTFEQIPLERLYGPGVVWHLHKAPLELITAADLEAARPRVERGDIVLLDTGWSDYVNTEKYEDHPYLDVAAARWLVEHGVKLLGVDFSTPDLTAHKRPAGFTWPVHLELLSRGILVAEHVTNMRSLRGHRIEAFFNAPALAGSDGSPARAIARRID